MQARGSQSLEQPQRSPSTQMVLIPTLAPRHADSCINLRPFGYELPALTIEARS